ncbi:integrin alpha-PS1-like [Ornithodoros turicata]|uniref:integrin alpha-PS1-like n=1 Tax=Ornithodoros turicata TaxID=34597 RepID=UPI0031389502
MEVLLVFVTFVGWVCAFNLEPRLPIFKLGEKGTYFGYSVSEHSVLSGGNNIVENILLIGAPRTQTWQPGTNKSGAVYRCPITSQFKDCHQINIETSSAAPPNDIMKDDQWLGVTVKSQGAGGYILACAHRHVIKGESFRWGNGICYTLRQDLAVEREWDPCLNRPVDKAHEQFGYCAAGTSGLITEDDTILLGAPGPYTWKGTVFSIAAKRSLLKWAWSFGPLLDSNSPVEKYSYLGMAVAAGKFYDNTMTYVAGAPRSNGTGRVVFFMKGPDSVLYTRATLEGEQFASSFGYSLTSLDINKDGYVDLVVGAPFYHGKGQGGAIYIYMNAAQGITNDTKPIKLVGKEESRYGFGLSTLGDINKDGFPDLAVGAPYETGGGAVYIYLGSKDGIVKEPSQVIVPADIPKKVQTNRPITTFGYSLSGGLDMDANGYPDLLVGNYEADSVILLRSRPIINITTSVSGELTNIDPNRPGCSSDPGSDDVCFSIEACFRVDTGSLVQGRSPRTRLKLEYSIESEPGKKYSRVWFNAPKSESFVRKHIEVDIYRPHQQCTREIVYLRDKSDIQSPIKFKLTYKLDQKDPVFNTEKEGLPDINNFPILNQQEASKIFEARFLRNCSNEDYCLSDLHIEADLVLPREDGVPILHLGEEYINMSVKVHNYKEPAYDAVLYIQHPPTVSYVKRTMITPSSELHCRPHNATLLSCDLGNPFNQGTLEFYIRFSTLKEAMEEKRLAFVLRANTTSNEENEQDDIEINVRVVRVAQLDIRGATEPEQVWYGGKIVGAQAMTYLDEVGSEVRHKYQVFNQGPYTVPQLDVVVTWPFEVENNQRHGKYLLYMTKDPVVGGDGECRMQPGQVNPLGLQNRKVQPAAIRTRSRQRREVVISPEEVRLEGKTIKLVTMKCNKGSARCFQFRCLIRNLKKSSTATITITANLWNATLVEDYPAVDQVSIFSSAEIQLDPALEVRQRTEDDYAEAETKAYPDASLYQAAEGVALWIIILSVCAGILLLLIVIFILYKLGFFKRKRPREGYSPAPTSDKELNGS